MIDRLHHLLSFVRKMMLMLMVSFSTSAWALNQDDAFLSAREAYQRGQAQRLDSLADELSDYPLYPYVAYWQLRLRVAELDDAQVHRFIAEHADTLLSQRLRADWIRQLGKSRQWEAVEREYRGITMEDSELMCHVAQARMAQGESALLKDIKPLWFQGTPQPESCGPLFEVMLKQGLLTQDDVWTRLRLTLEGNNVSFARNLLGYLPAGQRPDVRQMEAVARNPQRHLERKSGKLKTRAERELMLFAVSRSALSLPAVAASRFEKIQNQFSAEERAYAWAQIATAGARKHRPEAMQWFKRAGDALEDRHLVWKTRLALRQGDWETALQAIAAMSERERQFTAWRYWKARALASAGHASEANEILAPLSQEHTFYGQLAMEELGTTLGSTPDYYEVSSDEVRDMERRPGIQRALKFYQLGLRHEGALEWRWTIRFFDDAQLLTAAEVAQRAGWYERAIDTAERTQRLHDFALRFPLPYRHIVEGRVRQMELDEAWVYGLMRQESRFAVDARSSAGAQGLMQLMPATARSVARQLGLAGYHRSTVTSVDTNVSLGTYHLRDLLGRLQNQPMLASAAYNAGYSRARDWKASQPLEGAVYAETIPFTETRDYVRKVMSNTMHYARVLGQAFVPLKQRLGTVGARPAVDD